MKKKILLLLCLPILVCSCYTSSTLTAITEFGSITIYNDDNTIFKRFDNITITEQVYDTLGVKEKDVTIFQPNGLNFRDNNTHKSYYISNSFKYIIEYHTFVREVQTDTPRTYIY